MARDERAVHVRCLVGLVHERHDGRNRSDLDDGVEHGHVVQVIHGRVDRFVHVVGQGGGDALAHDDHHQGQLKLRPAGR
jgi:hypothetical protein